jgi:hypothetical protein
MSRKAWLRLHVRIPEYPHPADHLEFPLIYRFRIASETSFYYTIGKSWSCVQPPDNVGLAIRLTG